MNDVRSVEIEENGIILTNGYHHQFQMHYAGGDLYWTMLDYFDNNTFYITNNNVILFEYMEYLFSSIKSNYKLYKTGCFEWISEAYGIPDEANKLIISKTNNKYNIRFFQNPKNKFNRKDICSICFSLSGSKYQNISNIFSIMLNKCIKNEHVKSKLLKY